MGRGRQTVAGGRPSVQHRCRQLPVSPYPIEYLNKFVALSMNRTEKSLHLKKSRIYNAVLSLQVLPLFLIQRFLLKGFSLWDLNG